jgi:hypothetical protein
MHSLRTHLDGPLESAAPRAVGGRATPLPHTGQQGAKGSNGYIQVARGWLAAWVMLWLVIADRSNGENLKQREPKLHKQPYGTNETKSHIVVR